MFGEFKKKLKESIERIGSSITEKAISESDLNKNLEELKISLLQSDTAYEIAEKICERIKKELVGKVVKRGKVKEIIKEAIKNTILEILDIPPIDIEKRISEKEEPYLILFLGVNGVGKTLSLAKVAKYLKDKGFKPLLAAGDTWRTGAIHQIKEYAEKIGVEVIAQKYGADSCAVVFDSMNAARARKCDVVLADSAGRSNANVNLMEELKKIVRINKPDLKILVVDALTGNDVVEQAKKFDEAVGVDGVIVTKMDVYEKGGSILSVIEAIKKPIIFIGVGQGMDDIEKFNANKIVEELLP